MTRDRARAGGRPYAGPGAGTLDKYFPGAVIEGNVIAGGDTARYPRNNQYPGSLAEVRFVDQAGGNFRLADGSRYKKSGAGVDMDALVAAGALAAPELASR